MSSYRVVTVLKTVYVHNVVDVSAEDGDTNTTESFRKLMFYRQGAPPTTFPMENVVSYEVVRQ
jgi:hypothetical protein